MYMHTFREVSQDTVFIVVCFCAVREPFTLSEGQ